jgi:hypothetical protein
LNDGTHTNIINLSNETKYEKLFSKKDIHPNESIKYDIDVQHQYKIWYGVPMPDHLKHLVKTI